MKLIFDKITPDMITLYEGEPLPDYKKDWHNVLKHVTEEKKITLVTVFEFTKKVYARLIPFSKIEVL